MLAGIDCRQRGGNGAQLAHFELRLDFKFFKVEMQRTKRFKSLLLINIFRGLLDLGVPRELVVRPSVEPEEIPLPRNGETQV
jgi:hypothetical protein